jgi:predicted RNA-binding protein with PUA-like domain
MVEGDLFFFYHSSCATPGIAGIGKIARSAYPDPSALDPESPYYDANASTEKNRWSAVDVGFIERFPTVLPLLQLKAQPALTQIPLVQKGSRLSVMPITEGEWRAILSMR